MAYVVVRRTVTHMAARIDLQVTRGDYLEHFVLFEDDNGAAIDVSQFSWVAECRAYPAGPLLEAFSVDTSEAARGVLRIHTFVGWSRVAEPSFWALVQRDPFWPDDRGVVRAAHKTIMEGRIIPVGGYTLANDVVRG